MGEILPRLVKREVSRARISFLKGRRIYLLFTITMYNYNEPPSLYTRGHKEEETRLYSLVGRKYPVYTQSVCKPTQVFPFIMYIEPGLDSLPTSLLIHPEQLQKTTIDGTTS